MKQSTVVSRPYKSKQPRLIDSSTDQQLRRSLRKNGTVVPINNMIYETKDTMPQNQATLDRDRASNSIWTRVHLMKLHLTDPHEMNATNLNRIEENSWKSTKNKRCSQASTSEQSKSTQPKLKANKTARREHRSGSLPWSRIWIRAAAAGKNGEDLAGEMVPYLI
jgi:hypothetical protein